MDSNESSEQYSATSVIKQQRVERDQSAKVVKMSIPRRYVPRLKPLPRGRSWCSLSTNILSEDKVDLSVAPYFGEDDREGVKVLPFERGPQDIEPTVSDTASIETIRHLVWKCTKGFNEELREKFVKVQVLASEYSESKGPSESEIAVFTPIQSAAESLNRALCHVLSLSSKQVKEVGRIVILRPGITPSIARKPLYYINHFRFCNAGSNNIVPSEHGDDIYLYDAEFSGAGDVAVSYTSTTSYSNLKDEPLLGLNALHLRANRPCIGGYRETNPSERKRQGDLQSSTDVEFPSAASYLSFFKQHDKLFNEKGIDYVKLLSGSAATAYDLTVESFQLLYCRR